MMAKNLAEALAPMREKNIYYTAHPDLVSDMLAAGEKKAAQVAGETLAEVRAAIQI
jgi:hypothetical protein